MNMKKIVRACGQHFELLYRAAAPRKKQLIYTAAVILFGIGIAVLVPMWVDFSVPITSAEMEALARFVQRTDSPVVRQAFEDASQGGTITVKKAEAIIDLAKAQMPGYGLASDR